MTEPASPRLTALAARMAAGDTGVMAEFWADLAEAGTPLIEPSDEAGSSLVTLVLRAEPDEEYYVAPHGLGGFAPGDRRMRRLDGTDIAYRTYLAPSTLRTIYAFSRMARPDEADLIQDPLSRRPYVYPADEEDPSDSELHVSMVELPDAPPVVWSKQRGAPTGDTQVHRFQSRLLGGERRVFVHAPAGYDATADPYPLVVLIDGWAFTRLVSAPTTLDNLFQAGAIPTAVTVMPDSPDSPARTRDLWLYPPFNGFLADELLPWARERWHLTNDPSLVVAAGSSLGGLAASYFALEHPHLCGRVLSMSGAYQLCPEGDLEPVWMARELARRTPAPVRFWLNAGILECHPFPADVSLRGANRHVRDVLHARGYDVTYREFPGGHDYFWWVETLGEGLIALLARP